MFISWRSSPTLNLLVHWAWAFSSSTPKRKDRLIVAWCFCPISCTHLVFSVCRVLQLALEKESWKYQVIYLNSYLSHLCFSQQTRELPVFDGEIEEGCASPARTLLIMHNGSHPSTNWKDWGKSWKRDESWGCFINEDLKNWNASNSYISFLRRLLNGIAIGLWISINKRNKVTTLEKVILFFPLCNDLASIIANSHSRPDPGVKKSYILGIWGEWNISSYLLNYVTFNKYGAKIGLNS